MTRFRFRYPILVVAALALLSACGGDAPDPALDAEEPLPDTLTTREQASFAVDLKRHSEMSRGRLDTVDMTGTTEGAMWHVQILNYRPDFIAMTFAAAYAGTEEQGLFAADRQPQLVDNLGNVYLGTVIASNPRFAVDRGTTAVGVYVFRPPLDTSADSLTLFVNDSTAPVIEVGPFGTFHDPSAEEPDGGLRMRSR